MVSLNLRLLQDSFDTFSEFVHAYIDRVYPKYEKNVQTKKLLEKIRDNGIKDPHTGDFTTIFYKAIYILSNGTKSIFVSDKIDKKENYYY